MTIISYSGKRENFLSDSVSIWQKRSLSFGKIFVLGGCLFSFFFFYTWLLNWQSSAVIKERKIEKEIQKIEEENNILKAKLAEINSLKEIKPLLEEKGYQMENHPEYLSL